MTTKRTLGLAVVCGCAIILLASCESVDVYSIPHRGPGKKIGHGPPVHAKAHGYRRKQVHGHDLEYRAVYGVYAVVGTSDCYYHDGHFYRFHANRWEISLRADSDWNSVPYKSLPPGLRTKAKVKVKGKGKNYAKTRR